ncbi:2-polyprenyl-3-methyl-5-hydroxy-6-metoxy-1,4-benzoquinol methylase [Pedobacter cryoconitis]|uniref:2-polyprenyl-3-methyl-5-hydroxy-6-metoxy-1, 4-benzoquinol methylase n=1 Tax=Pedobacter cryoconitis TaxID=188932 RepID=A0A7W9DXC1_9SPHI|nr:methyltransferase domain-containing protein [Pedobacter cryoconitis]MBB5634718.1 2-polyprenyl-3-methyl-5-hydroxy-6-metoxy-1,4-benzoquinol methylase [Pedobacter cryoconitis]MBB6272151.1 2-polyprenyl-3-methyl-5-hydroxy-6-metoxy-1,4-benzoquinol methylase [Pedobacter cryoconitis]
MFIDTTNRSTAPEIMDNFDMEGEILRDALDKIASINRLLGGNKVTLEGIKFLIKTQPKSTLIRITDIGCGNGDMLRALADYAQLNQLNFVLTGIDANNFTVAHARSLSAGYTNISYECKDVFNELNQQEPTDIILCTLTLHHFKDQEIIALLQSFQKTAGLGFVINDLQRSAIAYYLFLGLCFVFRLNAMSREDGLVSILRGFKKADLLSFSKTLGLKNYVIKWKWAFRYQWIVKI